MSTLDRDREQQVAAYAAEVQAALGDACVGVVLYGSAAGADWVAGRSDLNTVIVLREVTVAALDALAPVLARWRRADLAPPVLLDRDQVERARRLFPMELDDIRRQHRVLAGGDPFAGIAADAEALRRECAQEAFGKLLRLRAAYLEHAGAAAGLAGMMAESVKSFLIVLRHLLRLRGAVPPEGYAAALAAGEAALGPLPAMRRALALRDGEAPPGETQVLALAADYVGEAGRMVAAVQADCG